MKELEEEVHPWMFILVSILCLATARCHGQGSVHITFDGYPFLKPGTAAFVQQYSEGGVWFRPLGLIAPGNGFVRRASSPSSGWPDSGTAYVQAGFGGSPAFRFA